MKSTSFEWMPFWDISVYLAKPGDRIRLGTGSDYIMRDVWAESVMRINEDGTAFFTIIFNSGHYPPQEVVVHECFHLLFQLLEYAGEGPLSMQELQKEIYAKTYESLFHKVMQALVKLGVYKEVPND